MIRNVDILLHSRMKLQMKQALQLRGDDAPFCGEIIRNGIQSKTSQALR